MGCWTLRVVRVLNLVNDDSNVKDVFKMISVVTGTKVYSIINKDIQTKRVCQVWRS
jgi:hypothetical protein